MIGIKRLADALTKKGLVKTGLQVAATAAGGPMAGKVVEAVAEAMGLPGESPDYLARIVETADPKDLAKLREIEANLEVARMEDTQHARMVFGRETSKAQILVASFVGVMVSVMTWAMLWIAIPEGNRDIVIFMAGNFTGWFGAVVTYLFGSSAGSARKDMMNK